MQNFRNKSRTIIKDDVHCRHYYKDLAEVSQSEVHLLGQLLKVLQQSLHGTAGTHPGISNLMQEKRQKYYLPSIETFVRNWVRQFQICIQDKHISNIWTVPKKSASTKGIYCQNYRQVDVTRLSAQQLGDFRDAHLLIQFSTPRQKTREKSIQTSWQDTPIYLHSSKQPKKRFRLPSYTRSSGITKHKFETSHNKTCANNQDPRAGPCHNQNIFEKAIGRIQETIAPIYTHCNLELQHHVPFQYFQYFQYTKHSISWQSAI